MSEIDALRRRRIEDEAIAHVVRVHGHRGGEDELARWLDAHEDHREGYAAALSAWHFAAVAPGAVADARASASTNPHAGIGTPAVAHYESQRARGVRSPRADDRGRPRAGRRIGEWTAVAAMVALALSLVGLGSDLAGSDGHIARYTLADGSVLALTSDAAVDLRYDATRRNLALRHGALQVEVAPDAERPLAVHTGELVATAIGTAFAVERDTDAVRVAVQHGIVRVDCALSERVLHAGEGVRCAHGKLSDDAATIDWLDGQLVFEQAPLGDVLRGLGRWTGAAIVCRAAACDTVLTVTTPVGEAGATIERLAARHDLRLVRIAGYAWAY